MQHCNGKSCHTGPDEVCNCGCQPCRVAVHVATARALVAERDAYREALRALVGALHPCDGADGQGGCSRVAVRGMFGDSFRIACDEHGDDMCEINYAAPLRAALALLKGPA